MKRYCFTRKKNNYCCFYNQTLNTSPNPQNLCINCPPGPAGPCGPQGE